MVSRRFDVFLTKLDPTVGSEMRKTRPCVVVSPDEMNRTMNTVLVAPLTSVIRGYPFRPSCIFAGREGQIALDQIRCVDRHRLVKHLGQMDLATQLSVKRKLAEMFG